MLKINHDLFTKLIVNDLKELFGNIFNTQNPYQGFFNSKELDTVISVTIKGPNDSVIIILQFNFQFLSSLYPSISGLPYNDSLAVQDFGKEIINIIGGKLIDILKIPDLNLGLPLATLSQDFSIPTKLTTKFTIYNFIHQDQCFKLHINLDQTK